MKLGQPLIPPPPKLESEFLRRLLLRSAYLNRKEKRTAVQMLIRTRESLREKANRMARRWGVSQQVVHTAALELLFEVADSVELFEE